MELCFRRIFGFHKNESVKGFIRDIGRLALQHIIGRRRVKFYCHVLCVNHRMLLENFSLNLTNHSDDSDLIGFLLSDTNVIC
jgi:hypothetical protein